MTKKTALITGASSGIGLALAHIHAERGGDLILVARRQQALETLKQTLEKKHGVNVLTIPCDLAQTGAAKQLYTQVKKSGVSVDYLMNNAGFGLVGAFHELPLERQQQMMQLNMLSLAELTHCFIPDMLLQHGGKILNTSSTASLVPGPNQAVYYATKAFVTSLSNALAKELSASNITVTNLMPGPTESEFGRKSGMDKTDLFAKTVTARFVAEAGYQAMLAGALDVISGLSLAYRLQLKCLPFLPKQWVLKQISDAQQMK